MILSLKIVMSDMTTSRELSSQVGCRVVKLYFVEELHNFFRVSKHVTYEKNETHRI